MTQARPPHHLSDVEAALVWIEHQVDFGLDMCGDGWIYGWIRYLPGSPDGATTPVIQRPRHPTRYASDLVDWVNAQLESGMELA